MADKTDWTSQVARLTGKAPERVFSLVRRKELFVYGERERERKRAERMVDGCPHVLQENVSFKLDVLERWFRRDMLFMLELEGLSGVLQPRACGKRWW